MLSVLSCLDTRKNQRKSRLKSPTRWVPRGRYCHAAQLAPPAAWLKQCRLGIPAPRSASDPFACRAFMPFLLIPATFNVSRLYELRGECPSPAGAEDKDKIIQDSKFKIQELVRLPVDSRFKIQEPVRLLAEHVRLLTDSPFDRCYSELFGWCYSEPVELLIITPVKLLRARTCPTFGETCPSTDAPNRST